MKRYYLFFMISFIITSISLGQADIFGLFAQKEAGVTRNVIIDRSGKFVFLTRLFDREEFDKMKKVIFAELVAK
jgi:hypothetical protein